MAIKDKFQHNFLSPGYPDLSEAETMRISIHTSKFTRADSWRSNGFVPERKKKLILETNSYMPKKIKGKPKNYKQKLATKREINHEWLNLTWRKSSKNGKGLRMKKQRDKIVMARNHFVLCFTKWIRKMGPPMDCNFKFRKSPEVVDEWI